MAAPVSKEIASGSLHTVLAGITRSFAVGAGRPAGIGGAVAGLQVRHALAHRLDHARGFHAELQRHRERIEPAALVGVDEVEADGLVADADLAGAGLADLDVDDLEFLGTAGRIDANGFAHGGKVSCRRTGVDSPRSCHGRARRVQRGQSGGPSLLASMQPSRLTPATILLLATPPLLWAANAVLGRLLKDVASPLTLNFIRWVLAFVVLLPMAHRVLRRDHPMWRHWRRYSVLGLLGVGIYNAFQYLALQTSTPLNVTLVTSSAPFWMLLIGALLRPAPRATRWPARWYRCSACCWC